MTKQLFDRLKKILKPQALIFAMFGFVAAAPSVSAESDFRLACAAQTADAIGCVTLVLGKAHIQSGVGQESVKVGKKTSQEGRRRIEPGTVIRVGDQVVTQSNGTVLINFIDKASVSVRQDSHLEIINYRYDEANPQNSRVKFNLVHGVTRAISGEAAKGAREQFRLNTPIAAIGVRGTDFVVSATASSTQAQVNEGIIVMAPFSANCSTASFGPCLANSLELNGDSMDMIALDFSGSNPRILPASQNRGSEVLQRKVRSQLASIANGEADSNEGFKAEAFAEETFVEESTATLVATNTTAAPPPVEATLVATNTAAVPTPVEATLVATATTAVPTAVAPTPELPSFTLETPAAAAELKSSQLVWGRWAEGKGDLERITIVRAVAGEGKKQTVGDVNYTLFRDEGYAVRVDRGLGVVNFALSSAQAFYNSSTGVVAMQVLDGSLGIDFQQNSFATELNLNHELTGPVDFIAAGGVFDGGFFHSRNGIQRIAGSVSFDGTEAGYLFERQLEAGFIDGLTLWNSQ
jgi:hypothetical protein